MSDGSDKPVANFSGPVTLAFGNETRTTGWHVYRALEALGVDVHLAGPGHASSTHRSDVPIVWVESSAQWIPDSVTNGEPGASVAWLIDTHRPGRWRRAMPQLFGAVGFAQRAAFARAAARDGAGRLAWVPLAAPIDLARPDDDLLRRPYDIAFVGHAPAGSRRATILAALGRELTVAPSVGPVTPRVMMELYGSARIVVNIPLAGELNMRSFEAPASRAVMLCAPTSDLGRILPRGSYVEVQSEDPAAWVRAAHAIVADTASQSMADAAFARVSSRHTYHHRACQLLEMFQVATAPANAPRVAATVFAEWGHPSAIARLRLGPVERTSAIAAAWASRAARSAMTRFPVVKRLGRSPRF